MADFYREQARSKWDPNQKAKPDGRNGIQEEEIVIPSQPPSIMWRESMKTVTFEEYQRVVDMVEDREHEHRDCDLNQLECADGSIGHEHGFLLRAIEAIDRVREEGIIDPPKPHIEDHLWEAMKEEESRA